MKPLSICRSHPKPPLPQAQRFLRCLTATLLLLAASAAGCRTKPSAPPSLYDNEVRQSLAAGKAEFLNGNAADARTHFFQALSRSIQRDDVVGILQSYVNLISTDIREDELANARLLLTDARFAEESFALDRVAPHRVGPLNEVRFELAWIDAYLKLNTQDYPAVDAALEQAGRFAHAEGQHRRLASIRLNLLRGQRFLSADQHELATRYAKRALDELASARDGARFRGEAHLLIAQASQRQGQAENAIAAYRLALDDFQRAGYAQGITSVLTALAEQYAAQGDALRASHYQARAESSSSADSGH